MSRWSDPTLGAGLLIAVSLTCPASAEPFAPADRPPHAPPFTTTLSNNTPLATGMGVADTARALGTPLNYLNLPGVPQYRRQRVVLSQGPALSAVSQRSTGRLERRLGHNWMWQ